MAVVLIWMLLKYYSSTKKAFITVYNYKTSMDPRKCFYSLITHLTAGGHVAVNFLFHLVFDFPLF